MEKIVWGLETPEQIDPGRRINGKEILFLPICENQLSGLQVSVDHQCVF